ncbi:glycosyltransferase [Cohnella sp. GCM10012308]|uniref:glycosyltransferase n=1 Tax=Cohnella sp. GCM10012308 TaxID=3317329 RepID=UPI00361F3021
MMKPKVLAFCIRETPSALVGVITPLKALEGSGDVEFRFKESLQIENQDLAWADTVICIRGSESVDVQIIVESKRLGKYIIYFLDDDLLHIPKSSASFLYYNNSEIRSQMMKLMASSDMLWTTNSNIARKYETFVKTSKTAIVNAPAMLLGNVKERVRGTEKIRIGFAGSIDHSPYLQQQMSIVVEKLLQVYSGKIQFEFFGASPKFNFENDSCYYIPYENNHDSYREKLKERAWDIGLAPLPETEFHACKYFNKFLEYGAIEAAGIYSNVDPYRFVIRHNTNGLLINNDPDSWIKGISKLIEDEELRNKIKRNAFEQLNSAFTSEHIAIEIKQCIPQMMTHIAPTVKVSSVKLKRKIKSVLIYKAIMVIKNNGLRAIPIIARKSWSRINKKW